MSMWQLLSWAVVKDSPHLHGSAVGGSIRGNRIVALNRVLHALRFTFGEQVAHQANGTSVRCAFVAGYNPSDNVASKARQSHAQQT